MKQPVRFETKSKEGRRREKNDPASIIENKALRMETTVNNRRDRQRAPKGETIAPAIVIHCEHKTIQSKRTRRKKKE